MSYLSRLREIQQALKVSDFFKQHEVVFYLLCTNINNMLTRVWQTNVHVPGLAHEQ